MSRADISAGRAFVSLHVKDNAFTRGLQTARADLNKFGADMMSIGAKIAGTAAAIAAPVAFSVKTFSDFDDAMRAVGAVSQATAAELQMMTDEAKRLGATTSFTAVQVATLMTELGRAGFKPEQVNAMTGAVMDLARATGTDATLASGIMASSIRQFSLGATDATRVADVLTQAANATFNSVEGLGESLKYAGPVAADLGLSLEDTVAILGTLGNVGIQGSEAGTALRRLGVISAATGEKLKGIFNISNVDAAGNLKPLVQVLGEIGEATANLPVAERVAKMNEAFGLLGITSASVLSRTSGETMALAESLKHAEGVASSTAKSMDSGLGGAFRIILSAAEGLQIALGQALSGSIQKVTDTITGLISQATVWVAANTGIVTTLATMTVAAGAFGVALIGIGLSAKVMAVAVSASMAVVGVIKSVMGIAAGAITMFGAVTTAVGTAMYVFSSSIAVANGLAAASSAIAGVLATAWTAAGAVISAVWAVITAPIFPFLIAAAAVATIIGGIAAAAAYATLKGTDFSSAWGVVTTTLSEMLAIAKTVGGILMDAFSGGDYDIAFRAAFAGIKLALATAIDGMVALWGKFWAGAWNMTKAFFSNFASIAWRIVKAIATAITSPFKAAAAIKDALTDLVSGKHEIKLGLDTTGMKASANAEIASLEKELEARKTKREEEAAAKKIKDEDPINKQKQQQEEFTKRKQEINKAEMSGEISPEEAKRARDRLNMDEAEFAKGSEKTSDGVPVGNQTAESVEDETIKAAAKANTEAFDRETEALQQQIIALQQGEEAAERFRLAKQGLSDDQVNQVMALRGQEEAITKQQEAAKRTIDQIQEFADADYEKSNSLTDTETEAKKKGMLNQSQVAAIENRKQTPAQIAAKEKAAIEKGRQRGLIDDKTAAEATAEADIRQAEREHQERLKKFRGEDVDAAMPGASIGLKSGAASAATFSAQSLLSMGSGSGQGPQVKALIEAKKAIMDQTKLQQEQSEAQIAAIKTSKMKHP